MIRSEAYALVEQVLAPLSADRFFGEILGRCVHAIQGDPPPARADLFGTDPRRQLLETGIERAGRLTCHSAAASAPVPGARPVADPAGFEALAREYHERGYTVRVPDVIGLSPPLQRFARALELILGKPVEAEIFWSAPGLPVPVHADDYDILIVHLAGRKRWFVSKSSPALHNPWKRIGEAPPELGPHRVLDLEPGDLLYCPRGTPHTVESPTESLHLSIGLSQLTVRDAVQAALDHAADHDRSLREGAGERADRRLPEHVARQVRGALARLTERCRSDEFVAEALDYRDSRAVGTLAGLRPQQPREALTVDNVVRHSPFAISHVIETEEVVDFSQPGGHILIHRGAAEPVRFIAGTPSFRIADIPGDIGDDVRVALIGRLMQSGFLEPAAGGE